MPLIMVELTFMYTVPCKFCYFEVTLEKEVFLTLNSILYSTLQLCRVESTPETPFELTESYGYILRFNKDIN